MKRRDLLKAAGAAAAYPLAPAVAADTSRKSRLRSALCVYSYRDALAKKTMTYEDLIRLCVDLDVDGLDCTVYWFPTLSDSFLLPLRRLAYRNAVEIYSIAVRTTMTQPTPELRAKELESIRQWVDVADKLGAGHIRVFGGEVPKGTTEDAAVPWVVETLKRSAEYAGSKGIILGLENHGGITERAARIVEIVRKVDSPWVGINLDTGNFESNVLPQIQDCLPYAVNVQLKAEMRGADGKLVRQDWNQVIGMIRQSGYKGYLSLEYEAKEDASIAVPRLIAEMRRIIARG